METLLGVRLFCFPTDLGSSPFLSNKIFAAMNLKKNMQYTGGKHPPLFCFFPIRFSLP